MTASATFGQRGTAETGAHAAHEGLGADLRKRQKALRRLGRWTGRIGLALLGLGVLVMAPDPAGRGLFGGDPQGLYAAVPADLYRYLVEQGAPVRQSPPGWGHHGATTFSIFGLYLLLLLAGYLVVARLVPSVRERLILCLTFPLWFMPAFLATSILGPGVIVPLAILGAAAFGILGKARAIKLGKLALVALVPIGMYLTAQYANDVINGQARTEKALTARIGTIADRPGGASVPPDGTVTLDPMRLQPAGAKKPQHAGVPKGWVYPFVLRPEALGQPLRDQAHYLLAQQAYMRNAPRDAALHLRGLTGAWQPSDWHTRGRIGAMATWAAKHGFTSGAYPAQMSGGAPYIVLRYVLGWLLIAAGCLTGLAGLYFCNRSLKLVEAWKRAAHSDQ